MKKEIFNKNIISILILFLSITISNAENIDAWNDSATIYYNLKQYDTAINFYNKILATEKENSDLYYNIANTYYKAQEIPMAILYYEKSLKLNPNDEDILFNLQLARAQIVDKIKQVPEFFLSKWFNNVTQIFSSNFWAYLSIGFFLTALFLILIFLFSHHIGLKKISFWIAFVFFSISLFSALSAKHQKTINFDTEYAIITTPSIDIKSSPEDNSTTLFILHGGTKLQILDKIQEWYKIKIADGNTGWIKEKDFKTI